MLLAEIVAFDLWAMVGILFGAIILFGLVHVGGIAAGVWMFGRRVADLTGELKPVAERLDRRLNQLTASLSDLGGDVRVMATRIEAIERLTERTPKRGDS